MIASNADICIHGPLHFSGVLLVLYSDFFYHNRVSFVLLSWHNFKTNIRTRTTCTIRWFGNTHIWYRYESLSEKDHTSVSNSSPSSTTSVIFNLWPIGFGGHFWCIQVLNIDEVVDNLDKMVPREMRSEMLTPLFSYVCCQRQSIWVKSVTRRYNHVFSQFS